MTEDDKRLIRNVVFTLNTVSVAGSENLDKLLGCIQVLNGLLKDSPKENEGGESK